MWKHITHQHKMNVARCRTTCVCVCIRACVCVCSPVLLTYALPPAILNCSPQWLVLSSKVTGSVFSLSLPPCLLTHFLSLFLCPSIFFPTPFTVFLSFCLPVLCISLPHLVFVFSPPLLSVLLSVAFDGQEAQIVLCPLHRFLLHLLLIGGLHNISAVREQMSCNVVMSPPPTHTAARWVINELS